MSLNLCIQLGNVTRDLELKYSPKGTPVLDMGIAVNDVWYDENGQMQKDVTYLDVRWWGKLAESVHSNFHKGKPILVTGKLRQEQWTDRETGKPRSKTLIIGKEWNFAGGDPRGGKHVASDLTPGESGLSGETIRLRPRRPENQNNPASNT